jgi:hypothetical protein
MLQIHIARYYHYSIGVNLCQEVKFIASSEETLFLPWANMYRKSPYNSWRSVYTGVKSLNRVNLKKTPEGMLPVFKI